MIPQSLAHLDGLNFNRAWCLFEIGNALVNKKIIDLVENYFSYSYDKNCRANMPVHTDWLHLQHMHLLKFKMLLLD